MEILVLWPKSRKHLALTSFSYSSTHFSSFVPASTTSSSARNWNSTRALITTLLHIWRDNARTNCGHLLIDLYDSWVIKSDISRSFQTTNKSLSSWKATSVINFTNENQTTYLMMFLQFSQRCLLCINLSFAKLAAYGQLRCPSIIDLPRNGGSQS